jgi:hypothetical protein
VVEGDHVTLGQFGQRRGGIGGTGPGDVLQLVPAGLGEGGQHR